MSAISEKSYAVRKILLLKILRLIRFFYFIEINGMCVYLSIVFISQLVKRYGKI